MLLSQLLLIASASNLTTSTADPCMGVVNTSPVVAKLDRCEPLPLCKERDDDFPCGPDGSGNRLEDRELWVHWSNASPVDGTKECSAQKTNTIEICFVVPASQAPLANSRVCPFSQGHVGGERFLVYDRASGTNPDNEPDPGSMLGSVPPFLGIPTNSFTFPYDYWDAANNGMAIYLRVNGDSNPNDDPEASLRDGGFCIAPTKLTPETPAGDPQFVSFGLSATTPPSLPPLLNDPGAPQVCDGMGFGTSVGPGTAGMNNGQTPCVSDNVAKWYQDATLAMDAWSENIAYNGTSPLSKQTWENGVHATNCGADNKCPFQLLHNDMQGTWWSGDRERRIRMSTQGLADFDRTSAASAGAMSAAVTHEYFHNIQSNWAESGATYIGNIGFLEPIASALEGRTCTPGVFSFASGEVCEGSPRVSAAFGEFGSTVRWMRSYFVAPSEYPFRNHYFSSHIWSYVFEQYALPVDPLSQAHPKAVAPSMQGADPSKMLRDRRGDEGTDILLHFLNILKSGALPGDAWKELLEGYLGRSFENLMTDWHTAALLKSYVEIDPRWDIEWVGDPNVGGTTSPVAPFGNPPVVFDSMAQIKTLGQADLYDGIGAVTRRVDVDFIQAGDTLRSNASLEIDSYGAAYLSFRPEQVPHSLTVKLTSNGGNMPRFRVFVVEDNSTGGKVPVLVPQCATDPDGPLSIEGLDVCEVNPGSKGEISIPIQVGSPTGPKVDEILIVASAGKDDASFDWSVGAHSDSLDIIYPSESSPGLVSVDMGVTTEKFIAQVRVVDSNGLPSAGLQPNQFEVRICDNSSAMSAACIDVPSANTTLLPMTGGAYLMSINVPAPDLSSLSAAPYDLEVSLRGSTAPGLIDREPRALSVGGSNSKISMQLVMDVSGSMALDGRIDSAKSAALFMIDSLSDNHDAGLVTFHNNAITPIPLDSLALNRIPLKNAILNLNAGACTSLGDGLFEMQSNYSMKYKDVIDSMNQNVDQVAVVLSDGLDTAAYHASHYYDGALGFGEGVNDGTSVDGAPGCHNQIADGEGPWTTFDPGADLRWPIRKNAGQKVPRVNGVAFGPDAATKELDIISAMSGGSLLYVDTTATSAPSSSSIASVSNNLADAYRSILTEREGLDRSHTSFTESIEGYEFDVEHGVDFLKVSIATPNHAESSLILKSPNASADPVNPARATAHSVVFEVPATSDPADTQPVGGKWTIARRPPPMAPAPAVNPVFVEVAVHGDVKLHASIQPDTFAIPPHNGEDRTGHWVGRPLVITAVPFDEHPIINASAQAELRHPNGTIVTLPLFDDGQHSDGAKDDGIYGYRFFDTLEEGLYDVKITVSGVSTTSGNFEREKRLGVGLHDGPNDDGDCMPTWWEELHGLDVLVDDGALDPDGDNLSNCGEFNHFTDPRDPDTDDGGENDGSEVNVGFPETRNPLDPNDDIASPEVPIVTACSERVEIQFSSSSGYSVDLQSAATRHGEYVSDFIGPIPNDNRIELPVPNGSSRCYRVQLFPHGLVNGIASDWSSPVCVSTAEDTIPPALYLSGAGESPVGSSYPVRIIATDSVIDDHPHVPDCEGDFSSGVVEYQVTTDDRLDTEPWLPIVDETVVNLNSFGMTVIQGKVRDAAGNESDIATHVVSKLSSDCELSAEQLTETVCIDGPQFVSIDSGAPGCVGQLVQFNSMRLDPPIILDGPETLMKPGEYVIEWSDPRGLTFTQKFELELDISDACCPDGSTLIEGGPNQDVIARSSSVDYCVFGAGGGDYISLGGGDDLIVGEAGSDYILTGSGSDTVVGGTAQDSINGGYGGTMVAHGGGGGDQIHANFSQSARVFGGAGADHIVGSPGDDWIAPGSGAASVSANGGADTVVMFDVCEATAGMILDGGTGFDTLILPVTLNEVESAGVAVIGFEDIVENDESTAYLSDCYLP